jgi:hypothetical protein
VPPVSGGAQVAIKQGVCDCWRTVKCVACAGLLAAAGACVTSLPGAQAYVSTNPRLIRTAAETLTSELPTADTAAML